MTPPPTKAEFGYFETGSEVEKSGIWLFWFILKVWDVAKLIVLVYFHTFWPLCKCLLLGIISRIGNINIFGMC